MNAKVERAKSDKSDAPLLSRLETRRRDWARANRRAEEEYVPEMPSVESSAGYLLDYLFDIGPVITEGMGPSIITHLELRAWQDNLGIELQPWEVRFLRRLSSDYLLELNKAEKASCPDPWGSEDTRPILSAVAASLQQSLKRMAGI